MKNDDQPHTGRDRSAGEGERRQAVEWRVRQRERARNERGSSESGEIQSFDL